jgi:hypothetical protein
MRSFFFDKVSLTSSKYDNGWEIPSATFSFDPLSPEAKAQSASVPIMAYKNIY